MDGPSADDLHRLAEQLRLYGSDPNTIIIHPDVKAHLDLIERRRQHWYWRLWWRVRYAPLDLREWLQDRMAR